MELESVLNFLENKTFLMTGATGFLAKILVEKILRTQPNVKKLYLLIRATDYESANQRFQNEVIGKDLFKIIKQKMGDGFNSFIEEKVRVVPGDITCQDLGIKDACFKSEILKELDVIINSAATTDFHERYDVSLFLNTYGAKNVLDFAKKCINLKVFVHMSTAYVSVEQGGVILERPCMHNEKTSLNGLQIEEEKRVLEKKLMELQEQGTNSQVEKRVMKNLGLQRANKYGWSNVYVFTKALGEMLIMDHKEHLPVVIIRPTIITSNYRQPFPGWIEGIRTIDSLALGYGKGKLPFFVSDIDSVIDLIPGDMVVNATLVAMLAQTTQLGETKNPLIYQIGSSLRNPFKIRNFAKAAFCYFTKNPLIDKKGKPIIVDDCKFLDSMDRFNKYMAINYLLPLKGFELVNIASCQHFARTCKELRAKVEWVLRMVDLYRPYLFFKGAFDDMNVEKLRLAAREGNVETEIFYFDPEDINWEDYFFNIHFPGLVKYAIKWPSGI